jgi:malonate transporter and related proteins
VQALIDVILPVFVVIGFGYAAAWRGLFADSAVDGVMRYAQNFAVPCLLFRNLAGLDLAATYDLRLFAAFYLGAFASFGLGYLGARQLFARPVTDSIAIGFVCLFSNSLLLGLPITERAYGPDALAGNYAIISIHAPAFYAFGITCMELARSHGLGLRPGALARQVVKAIFMQPLVLGITAGFIVNLSGLPLPGALAGGIDMMAKSAIPAALFALGGVLLRYRPEGDGKTIAMICGLSLVAHPLMTFGLGHLLGLDLHQMRSAVVTAAMAPGVNAFMFANLYGVAKRVAASSVLIATALSIVTIWGWLQVIP